MGNGSVLGAIVAAVPWIHVLPSWKESVVIDLTFVTVLAFAVLIQTGIAAAIVLGLVAFKTGMIFDRLGRELLLLLAQTRDRHGPSRSERSHGGEAESEASGPSAPLAAGAVSAPPAS